MTAYRDAYRIFLMCSLCLACIHAAEPGLVAKVNSGELKEAKASWWGFDAEDSTEALQAALLSGVSKLVVDKQAGPWMVTPIRIPSDIEVFFEKGVEVLAKCGEFKGKGDSLIELRNVSNVTLRGYGATLRMRRDDYDAPPYKKAEWRHALCIRGSTNIKVYGLTLAESGGDGIYLGSVTSNPNNLNVHIKDVVCDRNYRQGISVITAENLLIENTVMSNTAGTPPQSGIDFEPNNTNERLKNIVMRNCTTYNNAGDGYQFYLPHLVAVSEPVSMRFENCRSVKDSHNVRLTAGNSEEKAVRGFIGFYDCSFKQARRSGVAVRSKSSAGADLEFVRCEISASNPDATNNADVVLSNRGGDIYPVGGVRLVDLKVNQPAERPWLVWLNNIFADQGLSDISGNVEICCNRKRRVVKLTADWLQKNFPPRFSVHVPRVDFDWAQAKVIDKAEGVQELPRFRVRRKGTFYIYAETGEDVRIVGQQRRVGRYEPSDKHLILSTLDDKVVKKFKTDAFNQSVVVSFKPEKSAFYKLVVDPGANSFCLNSANVPVALLAQVGGVSLISSTGSLWVPVPKGTDIFAFDIAGSGTAEWVGAQMLNPAGQVVWKNDSILRFERYTADNGENKSSGLWQIKIQKPQSGVFEDYSVDVLGVPAFLFLHPQRYWVF